MSVKTYENPADGRSKKVNEYITFILAAVFGPLWWFFNGFFWPGLVLMVLAAVVIGATGELYYALVLQLSFGFLASKYLHEKYINKGWRIISSPGGPHDCNHT